MKATLQIGTEVREGELFLMSHDINGFIMFTWDLRFDVFETWPLTSESEFSSEEKALEHFRSIGGVILEDPKGQPNDR